MVGKKCLEEKTRNAVQQTTRTYSILQKHTRILSAHKASDRSKTGNSLPDNDYYHIETVSFCAVVNYFHAEAIYCNAETRLLEAEVGGCGYILVTSR
ncbi:hypothetical protein [Sphingobacterium chuzhouense]|uniref:Uncharacterized protein n=1 Tax=Sphingobacterium chuzhouense TaxID=1742264 RepID=A0ABR7XUT1_9SPHI|nr:hypothetical protein [Sphingobacterium chuzhouense]MBD1422789.1 hypothetical protein [Sphingobacterium chuzhouense]